MNLENAGPKGLGGWLILPAISLFFIPLDLIPSLFEYFEMFQNGTWANLTISGSEEYHHLWAPLIIYEIVGNIIFLIFCFILIVMFFAKYFRFPTLMITFIASNLLFVICDLIVGNFIPAISSVDNPNAGMGLATLLGGAMVWIPYFLVSKRVKNTFVNQNLTIK